MTPLRGGRPVRGVWAAAVALAAAGCGQWSSAPVTSQAPEALLPLGPGAVVTVWQARADRPALAAKGRKVTLAWLSPEAAGVRLLVATSHDAAASFDAPIDLGVVGDAASVTALDVAAGASSSQSPASGAGGQVWVRLGRVGAIGHAWQSRDGGRHFEALDLQAIPPGTFDPGWKTGTGDAQGVSVQPPRALRAAGPRRVASPAASVPGQLPAAALDEHGALALAWPEVGEAGLSIVLRRAWVDWNDAAKDVRPFDAPFVIARDLPGVSTPMLAAVPGGVVVAWSVAGEGGARGLQARRVGLDMTCTSEQPGHPAHPTPAR